MVKKFAPPIKASIGRARIPFTDTSPQSSFERAVRGQMQNILKNYTAWVNHMEGVSPEVLKTALVPTFEKSQVYVPKDTRALRNSGYLETRQFRGRTVVEIGYARGGTPNYAAKVHEDLEAYHEGPTQAQFLLRPLLEDEKDIQDRIFLGYMEASGV